MNDRSNLSSLQSLSDPKLVVIAASAGGLHPTLKILAELPASFPAAVALVMHRGTGSPPEQLIDILQRSTALRVCHAQDGVPLRAGVLYVCPPGVHLIAEPCLRLIEGPHLRFVRPSADLMFESTARVYGERSIGVVLSGAGNDGAAGSFAISQAGGSIIVQQPETCLHGNMPSAALKIGATQVQLPPDEIASALLKLVGSNACRPTPAAPGTLKSKIGTTVLLADDHEILLQGLHVLIDGERDMKVIGHADNGESALRRAAELSPDVVVMDVCMPGVDGIEATRKIISDAPSTKIVALSSRTDTRTVNRILQAGASAFVTKHRAFGELIGAIRLAQQNRRYYSSDVACSVDAVALPVTCGEVS